MIIKFEFNLPDDEREYEIMSQSLQIYSFICDFSQQLRVWSKYGHSFKDADEALLKIREEFYKIFNEYKANIDL
jgi:hypothetical protein